MISMFKWLPWVAGAALGAAVAAVPVYLVGNWKGVSQGRALERAAALQKSMDLIRDRSETNEEISRMDDAALCAELGGRWVQSDNLCE